MNIDLKKAYDYYVNNINKSQDKFVLEFNQFSQIFPEYIQSYLHMHYLNPEMDDIPELNKYGKPRIVNITAILNKLK